MFALWPDFIRVLSAATSVSENCPYHQCSAASDDGRRHADPI